MKAPLMAVAAAAVLTLAACGGGGGGGYTTPSVPAATPTPTPTPTPPAGAPASQPALGTASVSGSNVQVYQSTSNQHTLYTWGGDTANVSNCTAASGCRGFWAPYAAPAGTSASSLGTGFGLITRTDDGTLQYTYHNFPMYTYSGDGSAGTANGQNINSFGGIWTAARPATATPAPGGTSSPNPCTGYYCG